jgi:lysozyme
MKTSRNGIELIKSHEGLRLEAYPDPATGGEPWTIGYGHTGGVNEGDVIDIEEAERLLRQDLERFERCVSECVKVDIIQPQFDALVCFAFNVGCGNLRGSTLLKLVNTEDFEGAAAQFGRWNKAAGKVMAGLTKRRAEEAELFLA